MAYHWIPPQGTLKINVHVVSAPTPTRFENETGMGAVYRDSCGKLRHQTVGVIPRLTPLGAQLRIILIVLKLIVLKRAFLEDYRDVIVETDNLPAYLAIKNFTLGAQAQVFDIISHIDICICDPQWFSMLSFVFPARKRVAHYATRVGIELGARLYTLDRSVPGVEKLLDWDMGLGSDHPDYTDAVLPTNATDPIELGVALTLANNVENLGLGQIDATQNVTWDVEENENPDDLDDVQKEHFQGGIAADEGLLFARDLHLVD